MENDSVRTSGDLTLVEMWIDGKLRGISISRQAIEAFLQLPSAEASAMSDEDRREFVRTHLGLLATAAKNKISQTHPDADEIVIEAGQLGANGGRVGDRRGGERRKGDRRKADQPMGKIGDRRQGERRKGDRRKSDRRAPSNDRRDR
jgi:hypothetical protein